MSTSREALPSLYADVDRLAWTAAARDKNKAFEKKKADYWKTRLSDSGRDPRRLWRHVDNVLCRGKARVCGRSLATDSLGDI